MCVFEEGYRIECYTFFAGYAWFQTVAVVLLFITHHIFFFPMIPYEQFWVYFFLQCNFLHILWVVGGRNLNLHSKVIYWLNLANPPPPLCGFYIDFVYSHEFHFYNCTVGHRFLQESQDRVLCLSFIIQSHTILSNSNQVSCCKCFIISLPTAPLLFSVSSPHLSASFLFSLSLVCSSVWVPLDWDQEGWWF